jgi:Flp pilus assembly protein TadD
MILRPSAMLAVACALFFGCGGASKEPNAPAPLARPSETPPAATPVLAEGSTDAGAGARTDRDPEQAGSASTPGGASTPAPLPPTTPLARGDGSRADAALSEGDAAYARDDFAVAEAKYREAMGAAPKDAAPLVGLARTAMARTNVPTDYNAAPKNPVLKQAASDLRKATKLDPKFAPAFTELGRALLILGKADEAMAALRKAIELAPRDPEAHSGMGVALLAVGKTDQAVVELAKAAELDPGSAPRQTNLGTALLMQGKTADAVRAYEAASRIAPDDARTLGDLGTALLAENQLDRASSVLKRAVELDPKRATLRSNLGYALQQKHDLEGAIAQYREAIGLDQKLVSAWINLATALVQNGQRAEAKKALEQAQRIDPTDPRVRPNLEELRQLEKGGSSEHRP